MKVALLAGGLGSRLSEETVHRPKPMVEIGGRPILWHIVRHFSHFGFDDFTIALGYKGESIKRWAIDLERQSRDRIAPSVSTPAILDDLHPRDWSFDLIETGPHTKTGGRIKRLQPYLGEGTFFLAWGDGVSSVDPRDMLRFHRSHGRIATVMVVRPPPRFGHVELDGDRVAAFKEKPAAAEGWINGGVFVLEPSVFSFIDGDETEFEKAPMETLAQNGELMAYRHHGFWHCMDTINDKNRLEAIWAEGNPPWVTWRDEQCVS